MAIIDWANDAAKEIVGYTTNVPDDYRPCLVGHFAAVIVKHSPFLPDVAYMPVPRCETCARWDKSEGVAGSEVGRCLWMNSNTFKSFGCVQHKPKVV